MSHEGMSKRLDEAERKRRKQELYLNIRDTCITIILMSVVVFLVYYVAMRVGYGA